jgi:secreted Zn-dependent insulinase-like peptidase
MTSLRCDTEVFLAHITTHNCKSLRNNTTVVYHIIHETTICHNPPTQFGTGDRKTLTYPLKTNIEAFMFVGKYRENLMLTEGMFVTHVSRNVWFSV